MFSYHPNRSARSTNSVAVSAAAGSVGSRAPVSTLRANSNREAPHAIPTTIFVRSTATVGLRQSSLFRSGKMNSAPWRNNGKDELATMRALTASLKKKNQERYGRLPAPKNVHFSSQAVTEDGVNQPAVGPADAEVVAATRRANRRSRAVRELTSTLNGSYWLWPSTRRAPVRS